MTCIYCEARKGGEIENKVRDSRGIQQGKTTESSFRLSNISKR